MLRDGDEVFRDPVATKVSCSEGLDPNAFRFDAHDNTVINDNSCSRFIARSQYHAKQRTVGCRSTRRGVEDVARN